MGYTAIKNDTPDVVAERALATEHTSSAVRSGDVERVTYGDRTVEIGKIDHKALGRPTDPQYERNLASVETRLQEIGVATATVVTFLPWVLRSDSTLDPLRRAHIKPPKDKAAYSTFVFDEAWVCPTRQGVDSPLLAFEFHPISLASEFSKINSKGVMSFIGIPADVEREDWKRRKSPERQHGGRTYGEVFEQTRQDATDLMHEYLRRGNDNDRIKIPPTEQQKAAARRLFHLGFIKELPSWVERQRDLAQKIPMCPSCQRACESGAATCTNPGCSYIIDPRKAYEISAIDEGNPALERLTRAEVEEMNISDYVAETRDEKAIRLKTPGAMKPLSKAAMRLKETEDEIALDRAREAAQLTAEFNKKADKAKS